MTEPDLERAKTYAGFSGQAVMTVFAQQLGEVGREVLSLHAALDAERELRQKAEERAEKLAQVVEDEHEQQCGCSEPGRFDICLASIPVRYALAEYRAANEAEHPYRADCRCAACDDFRSAIGCAG